MNKSLRQLFTAVIILFTILGLSSTIITAIRANQLNADPRNSRTLYHEIGAPRGPILASDGTVLAKSEPTNDSFAYQRSYANGALYAQNILNGLVKADPEDKAALEASGKPYIAQLTQLDSWAKTRFSQIPQAKRNVLTSHDAFGYFGRAYGVTFMAPQGLSSESEASAAQVAEIINQIKADGVKTWFMENQLDPRLVKQIASATGAQPGGELYPEALSAKGGVADTYVKAFRHNVNTLADSMK